MTLRGMQMTLRGMQMTLRGMQITLRNMQMTCFRAMVALGDALDVNALDFYGWTAAANAYSYGYIEVFHELLEHEDIDVNIGNWNVLVMANETEGEGEVMLTLLTEKRLLDAHWTDNESLWTYLHFAAIYDNPEAAQVRQMNLKSM